VEGVRPGGAGQRWISSAGAKPAPEGLASHRVARPWEVDSNEHPYAWTRERVYARKVKS
jgi:hypothetical protein